MSTKLGGLRWLAVDLALLVVLPTLAAAYDSGAITPPWVEPSISGVVFNDLDGDGKHDWLEPGLKGWQVSLCHLDMCRSEATGNGGGYRFGGASGEHGVGVDVPFGWQSVARTPKSGDIAVRFIGEEVSGLYGSVWKDGAPVPEGTRVEALVAGNVCGETTTQGTRESGYKMWVVSADEKGGCGKDGSEIHFRVGGDMANGTAEWHLQHPTHLHEGREVDTLPDTLDLIVGPEPAIFEGAALAYRPGNPCHCAEEGAPVRAYVEGRLCGESAVFPVHPGPSSYQIAVLPEALRAGCGTEGASISFTVGDEPANEGAVWEPGFHRLELTTGDPPPPTPTPTPWPTPSPEPRPGLWTRTPTPSVTATPSPPPSTPTARGEPAATPTPRP